MLGLALLPSFNASAGIAGPVSIPGVPPLSALTNPDLVISTPGQSIAAGAYNSITVQNGGTGILQGAVTVDAAVLVQSGGTLNTNCQSLTGAASFTLDAGGTLLICNAAGITASGATGAVQTSGTRSFSSDANYIYSGSGAQVTGSGLPAQVRNLTSTNTATLTLSQALSIRQVLTLNAGNLVLNGRSLTLLSDASGTALIANLGAGAVSGTAVTVKRYIDPSKNAGLGYRHLIAPVANATVAAFGSGGTPPVVNAAYNSAADPTAVMPFPTVYYYDQARLATSPATTISVFDKGWVSPTALTNPASLATQGFTVQLPGASILSFTGLVGNSTGSISLSRASGATATDAGWNLIGNPYPSPLDFSTIPAGQRTNMDAAFYTYESTSQYGGSYRSYVNGVGNQLIGSAQAFFVRVSTGQTVGSLTLNNANRITTYTSQAPVYRGAADSRPRLTLALAGAGLTDELTLYAQTGATAGADSEYDAVKLANSNGLNLASLTPAGEQLAIDGRAAFSTATIPLAVTVPTSGQYTLTAAKLSNLPAGLQAELVDVQTGARTLLAAGAAYAFTAGSSPLAGRFWLNLTPASAPLASAAGLGAPTLALYPNPAHSAVTAVGLTPSTAITVLDVRGRVVLTASPDANGTARLAMPQDLAPGVYVVKNGAQARRLVVE